MCKSPFGLQSVENPLAQQGKSGPAVAHAFNQLQFVDLALDDAIAGRQSEARFDCLFVSFNSGDKAPQFRNLAG